MTSCCLSLLSKIDRQSERADLGRLLEPVFNLSSILIYASMTMKGRLGGAVGVKPRSPVRVRRFVFADVSRGEVEAERAGVISPCARRACKRMQQTDIHASILY